MEPRCSRPSVARGSDRLEVAVGGARDRLVERGKEARMERSRRAWCDFAEKWKRLFLARTRQNLQISMRRSSSRCSERERATEQAADGEARRDAVRFGAVVVVVGCGRPIVALISGNALETRR